MKKDPDIQEPEPIEGLPEMPPEGENVLWQGRPNWLALANEAMLMRWVAVYFAFLAIWRGLAVGADDMSQGIAAAFWTVVAGGVVCGLLALIAWVLARTTVYTVTNRRIVMRIGAALTLALNLPYRWIAKADVHLRRGGTGTITFDLLGNTQFSYLVCWPHVRPWQMKRTQPALRCIPEAEWVAQLIAQNARTAVQEAEPAAGTAHTSPIPAE